MLQGCKQERTVSSFNPFLKIYTESDFSFQIVFLTLKLRNRLIFPFNLSIRFSNAVGFLKLAPNREYPTPKIRMLSRSFILPEGCEGAQCRRRRPSKKTGGIRVLEPNGGVVRIATHREVHSPQSTGKRGKRAFGNKKTQFLFHKFRVVSRAFGGTAPNSRAFRVNSKADHARQKQHS